MLQWAQMAAAYMEQVWKRKNPTVALLNIGEEESKGSTLAQETYELLQTSGLNFIGNLEGRDVPFAKVRRARHRRLHRQRRREDDGGDGGLHHGRDPQARSRAGPGTWLAGALLLPAFGNVRKTTDYREYGAGPLLGVNGLVFIGHGRSDAKAIYSALRVAREAARSGMLEALRDVAPARAATAEEEPEPSEAAETPKPPSVILTQEGSRTRVSPDGLATTHLPRTRTELIARQSLLRAGSLRRKDASPASEILRSSG